MLPFLSIIFSFDLYASVFDAVDQQLAIWKKKQPSFDTKNPAVNTGRVIDTEPELALI